jgi:hypothetical protein
MPKQYEAIRDKFAAEGMDYDEAQSRAAAIYNSKHPGKPVTGSSDKKRKSHAKARAWMAKRGGK